MWSRVKIFFQNLLFWNIAKPKDLGLKITYFLVFLVLFLALYPINFTHWLMEQFSDFQELSWNQIIKEELQEPKKLSPHQELPKKNKSISAHHKKKSVASKTTSALAQDLRNHWFGFQGVFSEKSLFTKQACKSKPSGYDCYEYMMHATADQTSYFLKWGFPALVNEGTKNEALLIGIDNSGVLLQTKEHYLPANPNPVFSSIRLVMFVPFGFAPLLNPGDSGSYVGWLRVALMQYEQKKKNQSSQKKIWYPAFHFPKEVYSAKLVKQVKLFQKLHYLYPDGRVGIGTYVALMQELGAFPNIDHRQKKGL